ncbi:MAG: fumarate hydratase [Hydrogenophilales bacterium CG03_land_8_20_14_0_80_62_28]|nr:fumarate hydratase [Betaproteobacteria bacterium]OIO79834.1 MAG: fumarate hydratase [Hydrogenophilaceae bacterium CG1_02_62_390]PIV24317.1 MAG: fumarate hydratase [Hydrogenophilales bacterium CG03_land_8_20_14_0_80_62_28]PIW38414.1 MAG: fumarate hydratase [Hydrogenophilales bacterium CG15_BIG_FIL_POST_REV_8_21_14_020_62_31]PIW71860.1 MAG: fumarate hydratase [Hydrogenophilales bacterium CG12_big_fil_rev_8_21_14_0_65_61_21]PIX01440.1 MAG: fumarate hydratase [Hydrogenophilales bacterium CG_4_8
MTTIHQEDFIASVADALQFISYYHPLDFITALGKAYEREQSPAARDAIAQILTNSRMSAEGHRPICQDTGIVAAFVKVGMDVRWDAAMGVGDMVNEGVRRAYTNPDNVLRASVVADPAGARKNTRDNTPAVIHYEIVPGDKVEVTLAAKGGGSENKSKFVILNPSDSLVDWVLKTVPTLGGGWCPPGILGIGLGGTAEKAMLLAKEALMEPVDIFELQARGAKNRVEELRLELYEKVNALGIGAQGLGGLTTVLDVKIKDYPTHAAGLPVAMIPNCAATRHIHFSLDGNGPAVLTPPNLDDWPKVEWQPSVDSRRVNLDTVTRAEIARFKPGETLLLSGKLLTGRDAAHKRIADLLARGEPLPVDFTNRFIYYVGPVDPVRDEVMGPAGPTTSTRMDKFTDLMLDKTGLIGMVGKAERGPVAIDSIKRHQAVYLMAVGGAAYLVSKAIKAARVLAFADLGMEAIYEFTVQDMPVTVAVDSNGTSVHETGPAEWRAKIGKIPVAES